MSKVVVRSASEARFVLFATIGLLTLRLVDTPACAADPDEALEMHHEHGYAPAGIDGADMIGRGQIMFGYTPMFMHMSGN